jgi:ribonuclease HII
MAGGVFMMTEYPDLAFERALWDAGLQRVAGIDEAGRGALAGPVGAAAVILPPDPGISQRLSGVKDSKQMSPAQREAARSLIQAAALAWGVGFASAQEIDEQGILPATRLAAWRAVQTLTPQPEHLLLDYLFLPDLFLPQTALIKGDCRSLSIAAASVLAKTARDALMRDLNCQYPGYGLAAHKGYGTWAHRSALASLGPSPVHRASFKFKIGD